MQDVCCEFLRSQLDPSNCLGIRAFADTHSCRELLRIADKYTQNNFIEVMQNEEFLLLPVTQLIEIISNDELNVQNEEQVYQAVMNWIRYNVNERRSYLAQVFEHVRFPLMNAKYLVAKVGCEPLVRQDPSSRDIIDEAKNYLLLPQERLQMQVSDVGSAYRVRFVIKVFLSKGPRTRPRKPVKYGEVLFAVGGWCSGDAINSVEMYDPQTNEWKMVAAMQKRRCGVGVAVLCGKLKS